MHGSLDNFLHDPTEVPRLSQEDKKRFEKWISKLLADPPKVSSIIVDALKKGMFSDWEDESINHQFHIGSYYPSMIERCLRQQAYSYLHPEPPTPEELNIFGEGRAIHELIALALRRSGLVSVEGTEVVVDLEFSKEAKLHGRIDDLLLIRFSSSDSGDEERSINGNEFKLFVPLEIKSTSVLPDEPKQAHYYQLSTYLLARNYPMGVLLYWAKRGGEVKAFSILRDDTMNYVLRERVFELHEALKNGGLPQKEAALNRDFYQCERCAYAERCSPFLIDSVPAGSQVALFDVDSTLLDPLPRRKAILQELDLPSTIRPWDIEEEETRQKFWEMYDNPKYVILDALIEYGRERVYEQLAKSRVVVAISSSRRHRMLEATRARLANLGLPISNMILREEGNFESDTKFKTKWASRLAQHYDIVEYFDRDAAASSMVMKSLFQMTNRRRKAGGKAEATGVTEKQERIALNNPQ